MRLAFFVNDVATEIDEYTTTRLARAAAQRGHQVWYVGLGDVELGQRNGQLMARAHAAEFDKDDTLETFMARIQGRKAERLVLDGLDVLFLRNSIEDLQQHPPKAPTGAPAVTYPHSVHQVCRLRSSRRWWAELDPRPGGRPRIPHAA
ncbi:MAG TPA: hypothetical protein VHQ68_06980, partial [Propionibacteriaceae bacterium]|nr:hypothetical protein [Propionibacteriaceae bacterium]